MLHYFQMNKENIHSFSSGTLCRWNKNKNLHILTSATNLHRNSQIINQTLGQNEFIKFGSPRAEKKIEPSVRNPQADILEGYFQAALTQTQSLVHSFPNFLNNQPSITLESRNQQVSWIFAMREPFRLSEQTLFHAITYMDMYLQVRLTSPEQLPLLATACLLISSKNNEIYQIKISKLLDMRRRAFDRDDILMMESEILIAIDFKLAIPSLYELYRATEVQYQLFEDKTVPGRKELLANILAMCLQDKAMIEYGYGLIALSVCALFSKYRQNSGGNRSQVSELESLRMKSPSMLRACERLFELISEAKLDYKLSNLVGKRILNNPESSSKYIEH